MIRHAKETDMPYIISLAQNEGWNPGIVDGEAFYAADPNGFFIGELDGIPISCISAVRYGSFGFIGLYIVEKPFRGMGYGMAIWNRAMEALSDCNIGLDGVIAQQENYKKSGFWLANRNLRFERKFEDRADRRLNNRTDGTLHRKFDGRGEGWIESESPLQHPCIVMADTVPFEGLDAYDGLHFPDKRSLFLKKWLSMPMSTSLAYVENSSILGFGTIRKCFSGYKVGPLYAQDFGVAEELFLHLVDKAAGETVVLDISEENTTAMELVNKHNMKLVFETARMYTGERPDVQSDEIIGITTFELG